MQLSRHLNDMWLRRGAGLMILDEGEALYLLLLGFFRKEHSLDVWQHATLCNGDSGEELVQFLVISDGQLQVTRDDSSLLVIPGSVASKLEDFSSQVLHNCSEVHGGTGTHALCVVALPQKAMNPANRELEPGTAGTGL